MKRKGIILLSLLLVCGCSNKTETKEPKDFDRQDMEKTAYLEKEDGWVFELSLIYSDKQKDEINYYAIEGYNLKYKELEGYSTINMIDKQGEVLNTTSTIMPTFNNNEIKRNEIKELNSYLKQKNFNTKISIENLNDYHLNILSKEELVQLYNTALDKKVRKIGSYLNLPHASCIQMNSKQNETFQLSYILDYGDIGKVNIEYLDADGMYLSDKVLNGTASEKEIQAQKEIDELEEKIIKENTHEIDVDIDLNDNFDQKIEELLEYSFSDKNK